jgi:hypothetical protein
VRVCGRGWERSISCARVPNKSRSGSSFPFAGRRRVLSSSSGARKYCMGAFGIEIRAAVPIILRGRETWLFQLNRLI